MELTGAGKKPHSICTERGEEDDRKPSIDHIVFTLNSNQRTERISYHRK